MLLMSGCNLFEAYDPAINATGKQVVAEWKQRPEVAAAQFEYRHGLDAGGHLRLEVMLKAEAITDAVLDEIVEIARKDCWLGTPYDCYATYVIYTTDDPPYADKPGTGKWVRQGEVELTADMEASYGPRPARPTK
ncbi:hypothetical protein UK23_02165 [Lentzea aerocolonigenes]|uniref:Uncharacterized protein n=1 Tax=Lentzea aerocolonigenes TaxID=68170 RepID=A0A0F0HB81_LENAE|nr:hypothetical protein UK23_02165 [Lentzea aerocolonigenes]